MNTQTAIGRLTKDVNKGSFKGKDYLSFTVAATNGYGDRKITEYLDCICFGRTALSQYLKKGQQVYVSGDCRTETNEKNGKTYHNRKLTISQIELISGQQQENQVEIPF